MQYLVEWLEEGEQEWLYRVWLPNNPKAVLLICHGMAEHCERYEWFAQFANEQNIAVFAFDLPGHGENSEQLGDFGMPWQQMVYGINRYFKPISDLCPNLPVYLFGHSLGSSIALSFALQHANKIEGLLLSGLGLPNQAKLMFGSFVAKAESLRIGKKGKSKIIDWLTFAGFTSEIDDAQGFWDWLSRDRKQVAQYEEDPYCGFLCSNELWQQFISEMNAFHSKIANLDQNLPIIALYGDQDPAGNFGKNANRLISKLNQSRKKPIDAKCYPGARHEIMNEINKEEVWQDVCNWVLKTHN